MNQGSRNAALAGVTDDPTNGSVSDGDLWRAGP